ncbi:Pyridinium-3,5-bisthiocarboxylic acid mononucleotide nickel insertion protein [bioreactor metagenome]|uniref:Pyridinium-3,5-bisthiocarboxylic acid mononucleotide nickel insertion protein n=1 Tax=bioreactor metagenome TaxID=1076179 RepID=A0A644SUR3_9ZZZZ|nr:LarC family nickel insertion protein [Desulfovibrio desulfuricans]MEA4992099.1 LarC family nickel insertion protein [Desulfovibrio desulfuricans]
MKILYYDCFAGISGDMNLAALIDLGVSPDYLKAELAKLAIDDEFALQCQPEKCNGIQGMQVHVRLSGHQHGHSHGHEHPHGHEHNPAQGSHLPHRNLADITAIITQSTLADPVKQTSLNIFRRIAEAEAKVHGKALEDVHFHEVGATDSIVDIVGAAICFHALDVDAVWSSPLELGGGFVRCAHGMMPVPAPATVEILHGIPTTRGGVEHEATTPTGAAIIAALAHAFKAAPAMTTLSTGYGIGHRQTERPNMLRVHLAEVDEVAVAGPAS